MCDVNVSEISNLYYNVHHIFFTCMFKLYLKLFQAAVLNQQQTLSGRPDEKLQQTMTLTLKRLDQYIQVFFSRSVYTGIYLSISIYRYLLKISIYRYLLKISIYGYLLNISIYGYLLKISIYRYLLQISIYRYLLKISIYRYLLKISIYRYFFSDYIF